MKFLSISAFALDFSQPEKGLEKIRNSGADFLHMDVMDGKFVPLKGLSDDNIEWLLRQIDLPADLHIMTCDAQSSIEHYSALPLNSILFHLGAENEEKTLSLLKTIREKGFRCGLVISPDLPVESVAPYIAELDEILLMSTLPGEPHSVFLPAAFERMKVLRQLIDAQGAKVQLSVDGGIDQEKLALCIQNGADKIVMGRAFFESEQPAAIISKVHSDEI